LSDTDIEEGLEPEAITIQDVGRAAERLGPYVLRTPVLQHDLEGGGRLLCKAECLQQTGSFKVRGAFNLVASLALRDVVLVAHSSGNHAQAVAMAASRMGYRAIVVMPDSAPRLKVERTRILGAEVLFVGSDSRERKERAWELAAKPGRLLVPPYDHLLVAAGQGTAGLELVEDAGCFDRYYCPVSGGGLMAGTATAIHALCPDCEIVGVEPESGADTKISLEQGRRLEVPTPRTIADGLCVRKPGRVTFPMLQRLVDRVELVSDGELIDAIAWALSRLRVVLEPSGAAALAVALRESPPGRSAVLLSGGNLDPSLWPQVLAIAGREASTKSG